MTGDPTPALTTWRLYNVVSTSSEWTSYIDGIQHFTTGTNTVAFTATTKLGAYDVNTMDGDIAEVIIYSAKLSSPDWVQTKAYIATKYGLTIHFGGR